MQDIWFVLNGGHNSSNELHSAIYIAHHSAWR